MMDYPFVKLTIAFLSLVVVGSANDAADANRNIKSQDLVQSACSATQSPTFCVQALTADNRTASASSPAELAVIALDLAATNATYACRRLSHILRRLHRVPPPSKTRAIRKYKIVASCLPPYTDANASLSSAYREAVEDSDFLTANYDAKTAADDAAPCGGVLAAARVRNTSLLWKVHNDLLSFSDIGFKLTYNLS